RAPRRPRARLRRAGAAGARRRARRRRGAGQGLARQPHGADRRGAARHGAGDGGPAGGGPAVLLMLYHLLTSLADEFSPLNVFRYLTTRAGLALFTAVLISWLFGGRIITWLKSQQKEPPLREDTPERHLLKKGTPTMGGVLILTALGISTVLWADLRNGY